MRLLDVKAVLDRENHVQGVDPEIEVLKDHDDTTAIYAILSHRWGAEVNYDEMTGLMKMDEQDRSKVRQRYGYQKIIRSCELAMRDGYTWLWIDTCCIDKRSSAELSEAINSMYRWYRNSQMCYVYLNDVDELAFPTEQDFNRFSRSNGWPEWFSRGWTLQELVAPKEAEFFNKSWVSIGIKQDLTSLLEDITRIPEKVLRDEQVLRSTDSSERPRVAHIMSWAADRKTTRVEDRAYSLLGLFGVNMPMLYGEGSKAFQRLQLEIIRMTSDHSIFAWNPKGQLGEHGGVLASGPGCFRDCHDIENMDPHEFYYELAAYTRLDIDRGWSKHMLLDTRVNENSLQLSIFNVTNVGIQLSLPVIPDRHNSNQCFKAVLPCRDRYGRLVTIKLASRGLSSYRSLGPVAWIPNEVPEFRSLHLAYTHDAVESHSNFSIDDRRASWYGFTRCGTLPCGITGNTVTFSSQGNTLIVLVYANSDAGSRFAVGLGYYLGQVWSRIVCDEYPAKQDALLSWLDFAKQIHDELWNAPIHESHFHNTSDTVRDTHLPGTIWDARVFCRSNDRSYLNVMIDIEQCPGCCIGPREHTYMLERYELWLPWISRSYGSHQLRLDGEPAKFDLCCDQQIALGDYGDSSNGDFERRLSCIQL
ncbi:hypothetical protein M404DRAFT_296299 [Pisolithus tinctorius Marx 270]|uniref:Uncharacterized protein n=1 Tax=Pisolithus tinctorius Marx 270 TaxID=870435 RepID=A0A0C3JDS5_PISTI|nr:hypothetical protein M404DRAFT_296299 [Pisolithus tinctorius Marx 270]